VKTIDPFTLVFTAGALALMASGFLFLQGMNLPAKVKGIRSWAYAMLLGWGSMSLRWGHGVIPDFLSLVLSNALATLALGLILLGLRRFNGQAPRMSLIWALGIVEVLCTSWFTLVDDNFEARVLVFSVYALVGFSLAAQAAFVGRSVFRSPARLLIGWLLVAMSAVILLQAISSLFFSINPERLDVSSPLNLLTLVSTNILILGLFFGFVMLVNDRLRAELTSLANTDELTLALNRRAFMEEAARALARERRQERPCVLLMLDLDHFKQINDRFGHVLGDVVLKGFADRVRQRLRAGDVFGRYGGEEFIVLLPGADAEAAFALAEQLRTRVAEFPFSMDGEKTALTVSVGLAVDNGEGGIPELIEAADWALYRAKHRGRNRVVMFDEQEAEAAGMPPADE
jgi:diguanylate cyclase (GGDEF)-like protein